MISTVGLSLAASTAEQQLRFMRIFCEEMVNSFMFTAGLPETIGMFTNLMQIRI